MNLNKVAIYAPGLDASFADDAIDGLRLCWPVLREFMTFHLGKRSGLARNYDICQPPFSGRLIDTN